MKRKIIGRGNVVISLDDPKLTKIVVVDDRRLLAAHDWSGSKLWYSNRLERLEKDEYGMGLQEAGEYEVILMARKIVENKSPNEDEIEH